MKKVLCVFLTILLVFSIFSICSVSAETKPAMVDALVQTVGSDVASMITDTSPPLSVSISGPTEGYINTKYTYTAVVSGGKSPYNYRWLMFSTQRTPLMFTTWWTEGGSGTTYSHSWSVIGSYIVWLIITDNLGQQVGSNWSITTVYSSPMVSISGPTEGKINTDYIYTLTITGGTSPYTYLWSDGSTASSASISWSTAGTYAVSVTATDNLGQTASASFDIDVYELDLTTHWRFVTIRYQYASEEDFFDKIQTRDDFYEEVDQDGHNTGWYRDVYTRLGVKRTVTWYWP